MTGVQLFVLFSVSLFSHTKYAKTITFINAEHNTYIIPKHNLWSSATQYPICNATTEHLQTNIMHLH